MLNETTRKVVGFMRSVFRKVLVVLVAVFALGAVASASALASPQWRENGVRVTESKPVTFSGTLTLEDNPTKQGEFTCSLSDKGTVGSEGKGSVTESTLTNCKILKSPICEKAQPVTVKAIHLPWTTQLYLPGPGTGNSVKSSGAGLPGWTWECKVLGFKYTDTCSGELFGSAFESGLGVVGEVLGGPAYQEAISCEKGGSHGGNINHSIITDKVKATSGANLSVTRE